MCCQGRVQTILGSNAFATEVSIPHCLIVWKVKYTTKIVVLLVISYHYTKNVMHDSSVVQKEKDFNSVVISLTILSLKMSLKIEDSIH